MKEDKGKGVAGDEIEEEAITQSRPPTSSTVKLVLLASSKRKKIVSKRVDTGNLPSHRGNKKQKVDPLMTFSQPVMVLHLWPSLKLAPLLLVLELTCPSLLIVAQ